MFVKNDFYNEPKETNEINNQSMSLKYTVKIDKQK